MIPTRNWLRKLSRLGCKVKRAKCICFAVYDPIKTNRKLYVAICVFMNMCLLSPPPTPLPWYKLSEHRKKTRTVVVTGVEIQRKRETLSLFLCTYLYFFNFLRSLYVITECICPAQKPYMETLSPVWLYLE
jgi:hypothetical protein